MTYLAAAFVPAAAQELEGDYLYKVTTVRAAPGKLEALIDWHKEMKASAYYPKSYLGGPFIMRHSQGDQWDLLVITPMEGWHSFYGARASELRLQAYNRYRDLAHAGDDLVAYSQDLFADGPWINHVQEAFEGNGFFHIEMFHALPGKRGDLYRQRQMENEYLAATGQTQNMIFSVEAGGDVDVFTIGFHESLQAFAETSGASAEEAEAAAKEAGFKDRADISFYLRSLISGHHDTLAVKVE